MSNNVVNKIQLPDATIVSVQDSRIVITTPSSDEILIYDSTTEKWINSTNNKATVTLKQWTTADVE